MNQTMLIRMRKQAKGERNADQPFLTHKTDIAKHAWRESLNLAKSVGAKNYRADLSRMMKRLKITTHNMPE